MGSFERASALAASSRRVLAEAAGILATLAFASVGGCAAPQPNFDPLDYLAVGVDLPTETATEERGFRTRGFAVVSRIDGRHFVALGARSPRSSASAVRILTERGIAMGVDTPATDRPAWRSVALLEIGGGHDLDGDGEPEVLLRVDDSLRPLPCIVVVRVRAAGDAFEVPIDARAYGARACPEDVVDLDGDGNIELLVGHRPWFVYGAPVPTVPIAFQGQLGEWTAAPGSMAGALARVAVAEREQARVQALARGDARDAARLALEIAWLDRAQAPWSSDAESRLSAMLDSLELDPPTRELVRIARASLSE